MKRAGSYVFPVLVALPVILFGGCGHRDAVPPPPTVLDELRSSFDLAQPGFGVIDYPGHPKGNVAKAYAMVLQAEVRRATATGRPLSELGKNASQWLRDSVSTDDQGYKGWGLPAPWDAFGDGSENPTNTLYTISVALCIEALLDQAEYDDQAPREAILAIVDTVLAPFVQGVFNSPSGMVAYSAEPADRGYDCFNPTAALAGQLQRYAALFPQRTLAGACRNTADRTMLVLLEQVQVTTDQHWYWFYSVTERVPNDLPHATYIIRGVRDYLRYRGTHSERFDLEAVHGHLNDFKDPDRALGWLQWPVLRKDLETLPPPRLYDLGIALRYCVEMGEERWATELAQLSQDYLGADGLYRKCIGCDEHINEYDATLLNGLTYFFHRVPHVIKGTAPDHRAFFNDRGMPLTSLAAGHSPLFWDLDPADAKVWLRSSGGSVALDDDIPLGAVNWNGAPALVVRRMYHDTLKLLRLDNGSLTSIALPDGHRTHMFRYLCAAWDRLWLVTYDPIARQNRLATYDGRHWKVLQEPLSIQDHLGYEQQPRMLHAILGDTLYLGAGRAVFKLGREGGSRTYRLPQASRILEMAADDQHVHLLVEHIELPPLRAADTLNAPPQEHGFGLYRADQEEPVDALEGYILPFGLRARGDHVLLADARSPDDLTSMLALDLGRMNGAGAMSFGLDNSQGEVAWSQSYYLTGLLDLLEFDTEQGGVLQSPVREALRNRLATESGLLADHVPAALPCRTFTVDRSPVLHAVQTGKLLLLAKRLQKAGMWDDSALERSLSSVQQLKDHLEQFSLLGEEALPGEDPSSTCLRFPKGCAFPYDGAGLPYNHQNCWAAGVLYGEDGQLYEVEPRHLAAASDVVKLVVERELRPRTGLPDHLRAKWAWNYWWGRAKEGWTEADDVSVNTPVWPGDGETFALARYRTFDAIAVLLADRAIPGSIPPEVVAYIGDALIEGGVEPFILPYLPSTSVANDIPLKTLRKYIRIDQQPDMRNALLVHGMMLQRLQAAGRPL